MPQTHIYVWNRLVLSSGPGRENASHRHFGAIVLLTPDAPFTVHSREVTPVVGRAAVIAPNAWHHIDARDCRVLTILVGPDHEWFRYVKRVLTGRSSVRATGKGIPRETGEGSAPEGKRGPEGIPRETGEPIVLLDPERFAAEAAGWEELLAGQYDCDRARHVVHRALELCGGEDAPPHRLDPRIEEALLILQRADADTPTPDELGRRVGLSGYTLMRRFKAQLGVRIREYVLWRRLMQGLAMVDGRSTIADIAQRTGFYDQAHLTRTVRRMVELAPSFFNDFNQTRVHVCKQCQ